MEYVVKKWHEGEVKDVDGAKGWIMQDGEFRPLMSDAMEILYKAVSYTHLTLPTKA